MSGLGFRQQLDKFECEIKQQRAEIERLQRELGECQAGWATGTRAIEKNERLNAEVERLQRERDALRVALEFYADPATYFAIAFLPDPPCGEFVDDFSDDHGDEELPGYRPGKRARAALEQQK